MPFREMWTHAALAESLESTTGWKLSVSEVGRILRFHQLRPHHVRMWLHSPDPNFREKAARVCQLYLEPPEGAVVVCVDEKPIQVLERRYPTGVGPSGELRFEYEYIRQGTCCLLAAFDTKTGKVIGRVVPERTGEALVDFMELVAQEWAKVEIYTVWDNLNTHYDGPSKRWTEFNARHGNRFHFIYTPTHASWMNQIEVWFSILERRLLRHGDFYDAAHMAHRVHSFIHHWNRHEAHPFRWTWRSDRVENPKRKVTA